MSSWANAESSDEDEPVQELTAAVANAAVESKGNKTEDEREDAVEREMPRDKADRRDRDGFTVCVGNLSYATTEENLGDFFHEGGCKVKSVHIPMGQDGKSRGFGFIEFQDRESADLALKANDESLNGRRIKVEPRENRPRDSRRGDRVSKGDRYERGDRRDRDRYEGGRTGGRGREQRNRDVDNDWVKGEALEEAETRTGTGHRDTRDKDRDSGRERGRGGGRGRRDAESHEQTPSEQPPATRPKLVLQPRKAPLEPAVVPKGSIFGEGKPRDASITEKVTKFYWSSFMLTLVRNSQAASVPARVDKSKAASEEAPASVSNTTTEPPSDRNERTREKEAQRQDQESRKPERDVNRPDTGRGERGGRGRGDRGDRGDRGSSGSRFKEGRPAREGRPATADGGRGDVKDNKGRDRREKDKAERGPEKDGDDFMEVSKESHKRDKQGTRDAKKPASSQQGTSVEVETPTAAAAPAATVQSMKAKANRFSYLVSDDEEEA